MSRHVLERHGPMGRYIKMFAFALAGVLVARFLVLGVDALGTAAERRSLRD